MHISPSPTFSIHPELVFVASIHSTNTLMKFMFSYVCWLQYFGVYSCWFCCREIRNENQSGEPQLNKNNNKTEFNLKNKKYSKQNGNWTPENKFKTNEIYAHLDSFHLNTMHILWGYLTDGCMLFYRLITPTVLYSIAFKWKCQLFCESISKKAHRRTQCAKINQKFTHSKHFKRGKVN